MRLSWIRTLYFCLLVGSGTPQRHPAKIAVEKWKHLKIHSATFQIQLTHSCAQWDGQRLRSVTEPWPQWGSHTHTHTHGMTAHHCPLIKTSFHSHPHSLSPSLLHSPMVLPSSPPLPHSLLRPAFTSCRLPFSFLLTPHSSLTFLWRTLTYKMSAGLSAVGDLISWVQSHLPALSLTWLAGCSIARSLYLPVCSLSHSHSLAASPAPSLTHLPAQFAYLSFVCTDWLL